MTRLTFTIPGRPVPKGRARYDSTTRRTYTPARTEEAEAAIGWILQNGMQRAGLREPLTDPLGVRQVFVMPDRRRSDLDNLMKTLWDAANGIVWADDSQIEYSEGWRTLDRGNSEGCIRFTVWTNPEPPAW